MKIAYAAFSIAAVSAYIFFFYPTYAAESVVHTELDHDLSNQVWVAFIGGAVTIFTALISGLNAYFTKRLERDMKKDREEVAQKLEETHTQQIKKAEEVKTILEETTNQQVNKADQTLEAVKNIQEAGQRNVHILLKNTAVGLRAAAHRTRDPEIATLADSAEKALTDFENHCPTDRRANPYTICSDCPLPNKELK